MSPYTQTYAAAKAEFLRDTHQRVDARVKFSAHVDDDLEDGMFRGIASATEVLIDGFVPTIIERGAFANTLAQPVGRVRILWQHHDDEPIGVPIDMRETQRGLEVIGKISTTTLGRDVLKLMRDGVIREMSIGFIPTKFRFEKRDDVEVRVIESLDLLEFSLVTFPANPGAQILEVQRRAGGVAGPLASELHVRGIIHRILHLRNTEEPLTDEALRDLAHASVMLGRLVVEEKDSSPEWAIARNMAALAEAELAALVTE